MEIDLVVHADRGFAVLHDLDVTRATTGSGHVRSLGADQLRAMSLVDNRRRRIDEPVLLLEDLADTLRGAPFTPTRCCNWTSRNPPTPSTTERYGPSPMLSPPSPGT